jgi:hypothetical protein
MVSFNFMSWQQSEWIEFKWLGIPTNSQTLSECNRTRFTMTVQRIS